MIMYRVIQNGQVFMIAPMTTLQQVLNLHKIAVARIERETTAPGHEACILHDSKPYGTVAVARELD